MKLLLILLLSSSAYAIEGKPLTDAELAMDRTCEAYQAYQAAVPTCNVIIERSQHHLVEEDEYKQWCGTVQNAKNDVNKYSVEYINLTHKKVDISKCPKE